MSVTAGVDSYLSNTEADTYHTVMNNAAWAAATTAQKDSALRYSTAYMDGKYSWIGERIADLVQPLGWPRVNAYDAEGRTLTGVPQKVKDAQAQLALSALTDALIPDEDRGGAVKREKVGELEVEYFDGAPAGRTYGMVDTLLHGLYRTAGSGASIVLVRA